MRTGARHVLPPLLLLLLPLLLLLTLLPGGRCQESLQLVSGDVTVSTMLSISNIYGQDDCGEYDADTLKELLAIQWFVESLNSINYLPGVKLGLQAYRTCQSGERATRNAVQMLEKFRVLDDNPQTINTTTPMLGVVGPGRTQEAIVVSRFLSSLPSSQRPVLISGSATGSALSDKNLYSNFFRVIPPDSTQVQVLLKLLQKLGWNYFAIVYDDDAYGRDAAVKLRDLARANDLCVPNFAALPLDYRSQNFITTTNAILDRLSPADSSFITGIVFIGSVATAREFLIRAQKKVNFVRFIFSEAVGLQTSVVSASDLGKGALAAAPPYLPLPEFRAFWNSIWANWSVFSAEMNKNPWLAGYYTDLTKCSISDNNCWTKTETRNLLPLIENDTQWLFEYYQAKATAIFAAILKRLHSGTCGANYNGVCLKLKQLMRSNREKIQEMAENSTIDLEAEFSSVSSIFSNQTNVGFTAQGEVTFGGGDNVLYGVFNYRKCGNTNFCFQKVGEYREGGELYLDTQQLQGYTNSGDVLLWPNYTKSQCMAGFNCLACLPPDLPGKVVFVPGDVYIVAVAPVNDKEPNNPLNCGALQTSAGADFVQSVLFAVKQVNQKRGDFSGIFGSSSSSSSSSGSKLGVVIFNSCSRELVINEKLIALYKGTLLLPDGRNSSHIVPRIAGYVGAFFSAVSIAMYEVLSSLDARFVMLSPANTSPELSDRAKYPLYLRMTSGKDSQAKALLSLVRDLGHQYVQVLYNPSDAYALALKESINNVSITRAFNICVVNNIASDDESTNFYPVLDNLRKNAWVPVVIVVLQSSHIQKVMATILGQMTPSDPFRFLGSDGWARGGGILKVPSAKRLIGSLTYSIELPLDRLFREELRTTDPLNTPNPWLKYFWEKQKQCYFDGSFQRKGKSTLCPADLTDNYVQDTWVPFYIDAVYAFALGLDTAMSSHCGQASLCDTLTSQRLVEAIRGVRMDLSSSGIRRNVFDDNGDGDVGFKLYQVVFDNTTADPDDVTYVEVGRYERDSLNVRRNSLWILNNLPTPVCPNTQACHACFPPAPVSSPKAEKESEGMSGALIGTIVVILLLVVAIVVLVVFLFLACRRLRASGEEADNHSGKFGLDNMAGPRSSGESRPLPPIRDGGSTQETSMGTSWRSDSGSSHDQQANTYDYLQSDRLQGSHARSSHGYLGAGSLSPSAGSGNSSAAHAPVVPVNSAGYVVRGSDEHRGYDLASPPYDRINRQVDPSPGLRNSQGPGSFPEGGRQSSQDGGSFPEGGRQNSQVEDPRESWGSRPFVFENASVSERPMVPLPERCRSSADSDYLTPLSEDYLTPRMVSLSPTSAPNVFKTDI